MAHRYPREFLFKDERQRRVFICKKVNEGAPILWAAHDDEGDWQFLCGGQHGEDAPEDPGVVSCLECTVAQDESLNQLAKLANGGAACRDSAKEAWELLDPEDDE